MKNYVLNGDVLCFTQDVENEENILVIEKKDRVNIKMDCFKFLKNSCSFYGHSYKMQRQFIIDNFNYYIKTPIVLSEYDMIIFFPTTSPKSKECIWIAYNNVERYISENDYTKIFFKGGKVINISAPYSTIDSQITKCIKIEKFINNMKLKKVY